MATVTNWDPSFAEDFIEKRKESEHNTQEEMAAWLGLPFTELKGIEAGQMPKTTTFLHICRKLELNPMKYLALPKA